MSAENVHVVEQIQASITLQDVVTALDSEESTNRIGRLLMELAEPDFETAMVGPDYMSARLEYTGFAGFAEAWRDWTSPFDTFDVDVERMIDAGEQVVSIVTMSGRTRTGGAEITSPGAAVWTVVDGRVRKVEFHIDRAVALRAAGLDPEMTSSD